MLEPGAHIVNVGGSGRLDAESLRRIDVYLRFGDAPAPVGRPELAIDDQFLGWEARPDSHKRGDGREPQVRPRRRRLMRGRDNVLASYARRRGSDVIGATESGSQRA